jgi:uncharacterized protein (DUF433 family)
MLTERKQLGQYIVADPKICHGKPTFTGTRIMVWQVLEMVADGEDWDTISHEWPSYIPKEAIAEAVRLASETFVTYAPEHDWEQATAA